MNSCRFDSSPASFRSIATRAVYCAISVAMMFSASSAAAKNHLWKFNEVYSNADGTIQFIEMQESEGSNGETQTSEAQISTDGENPNVFNFPGNLPGPTAYKTFLVGTAGYAALPDVPAPDFVMPDAFFDPVAGETLRYRFVLDAVVYGPGEIPTDGTLSIDRDGVTAINSPKNFAGETGSIVVESMPALAPIGIGALLMSVAAGGIWRIRKRSAS